MLTRRLICSIALALVACGRSSLAIPGGEVDPPTTTTTTTTTATSSSTGPCTDPVPPIDVVDIRSPRSATLFGTTLHVEALVDGLDTYAVIDLAGTPARLVETRDDLVGGARWTLMDSDLHARMNGARLEVIDAEDAAHAALITSVDMPSELVPGFTDAVGAAHTWLYFCQRFEPGGPSYLSRIDVGDPKSPAAPEQLHGTPCDLAANHGVAAGELWVTWDASSVTLYDLAEEASINSHGFSPDGVHQYGTLTAVKTDGSAVAATMQNEAYAFLYYPDSPSFVVYSSFGSGKKQLLDVVSGQALVAVPRGDKTAIVAFDIATPPGFEQPAPATGMEVELEESTANLGEFALLAKAQGRVIITDGAHLYDVPIGGKSPVKPLVVTRQGEIVDPCP